jgi:hypothetical protein
MIIKKHLIKIETVDNDDLFSFMSSVLRRVQKKYPDYLKVVEVDESNQTILFMSSSYVGANVSRILMEEQQHFFWHDQKEGIVKVERLPYKVDG